MHAQTVSSKKEGGVRGVSGEFPFVLVKTVSEHHRIVLYHLLQTRSISIGHARTGVRCGGGCNNTTSMHYSSRGFTHPRR